MILPSPHIPRTVSIGPHAGVGTRPALDDERAGSRVSRFTPHEELPLLHEIFEERADANARSIAVRFGPLRVTYEQLEHRANQIARHLRARGVERGSRVGLLLPRSPQAYAALLGILKAGAAYVPVDPECPPERASFILTDAAADALITTSGLARPLTGFQGTVVRVDADHERIEAESPERLTASDVGVTERDLSYIIYTSGSTGRPKGVMIEHRNAAHLVLTEARLFGVQPHDRVYQGFTLAFDASVEEVWLAFASGATLIAATPEMSQAGLDLSRHLTDAGVTVFSSVPTLLGMLAEDIPSLRLLIFGGEACPASLVTRWARPGRRMVNTYGPTEATVIATAADLHPGQAVTIGRAIPGYRVELLDDALRRVPRGEVGEICIGGAGVARGYVNRPEEERLRFVEPPAPNGARPDGVGSNGAGSHGRMYRTGDLGRLAADGNIEFMGRADGQVKIRGYRVELTEIEAVLSQCAGVSTAACAVREDVPGLPQLVGYVVSANGPLQESHLKSQLVARLPAYMIPSRIENIRELPRLVSGKLDRSALPAPSAGGEEAQEGLPRTDTERAIAKAWESLFHPRPVSRDADFFFDLGGHSLLAARAVSALRTDPRFARLSVADLYRHRTLAALAAAVDDAPGAEEPRRRGAQAPTAGEAGQHFLAGVLQSAGLYFVFGVHALRWVTPYLVFFLLEGLGHSALAAVAWAAASAVAVVPVTVVGAVAAKWLLLGRVRPGRHRLWGGYYLRWWFAHSIVRGMLLDHLAGTPLLPFVFRLLGARIGRDVYLGTDHIAAFDLVSIGDGSSVDDGATLLGSTVEHGELLIGPVTVGRNCYVGARTVLREHTVLEDGARLEDLSLLPRGGRIPSRETWAGSPARPAAPVEAPAPPPARGAAQNAAITMLYVSLVLLLPLVPIAAIVPGMTLLMSIGLFEHPWRFLAAAPVVGASFVILLTLEVVLLKWLLVGRVRAGTYPLHGSFYIRNWIVEQLMAMSLQVVAPIYATLHVVPWYRALGAKIGRLVELSTASFTPPDLLEIADGGTVADEASVGEPRIEHGWMTVARTRIGRRAFVGNSGVLPAGVELGEDALVGVLSIAPSAPGAASRPGSAWLGSPPIELPRRQASAGFRADRTYEPPTWLLATRWTVELLRVTLPPSGFILVSAAVVTATLELWTTRGAVAALLLLPVVYGACCAAVLLAMAVAKWTLIGRYKPFVRPLWSPLVWRLELVNALYEFLATPLALGVLQGTPLLPWYLRLLGARIGRRVFSETTGFLEWDLVEVGDRTALNVDCVLQTHLFEDRMLKASRLRIGADCNVGAMSVVLYDSHMEDGSSLDALSMLMKGETLRAGTSWLGIPPIPASASESDPGRDDVAWRQEMLARADLETPAIYAKVPQGLVRAQARCIEGLREGA
jgi:non-ribosomal peptide synthetase-like protein